MSLRVDIQRIAESAIAAVDSLLAEWLPDGKRKGNEYWALNPTRGDRQPGSFSVNLHNGTWHDFASGDGGGDLVSLLAYLRGCGQMDAALMIAERLGLPIHGQPKRDLLQQEADRQRRARERAERQQQADAERQARWDCAAARARHLWGKAVPADPNHPYLARKRIKPHHLRQLGHLLLVPIYWRGALVALQFITAESKQNLKGARQAGGYCPFGRVETGGELYMVEGIATAATLHEQTGKPVAAAMSAGNLLPAGLELKRRYPDAVLIVGGDDDRAKEAEGKPNAGKQAAIQAAAMLGCGYVLPVWPEGAPLQLSDFNDLHQWREGRL